MTTQTNEAKIVVSAQDQTAGPLAAVQARFQQITGAADGLKSKLAGIGGGAFGDLSSRMGAIKGQMMAMGLLSGGIAVGGIMAVKNAFDSVVQTAEKADRVSDLGGRLRLNAEEFQVFEKISKDANASVEETGGAFLKFKLNLSKAQTEGGKTLEKLDRDLQAFGITAKEASNMKPLDLMKKMGLVSSKSNTDADELLKIEKFRNLAGKTGATLIPVFEAIGTRYDDINKKMRDSGLMMSDAMAEQGGKAFKSYEKSKGAMSGLKMVFGIEMMPVFDQFSKVMENRMKANRAAMMPGVKALADVISVNIEPFLDDMDAVADKTSGIFKWVGRLAGLIGWDKIIFGGVALILAPFVMSIATATYAMVAFAVRMAMPLFGTLITGVRSVVLSMALLEGASVGAWAAVLGPVALVVAGVALVAAAAYWIYNNWAGVSSFFVGLWESISGAFEPIKPVFAWLGDKLGAMMGWLGELLGFTSNSATGLQDWSNAGRTAGAVVATAINGILTPVYLVIDAFKLLGASWDWFNNKEFNFKSTTFEALSKDHFSDATDRNASAAALNVGAAGASGAAGVNGVGFKGVAGTAPVAGVAAIAKQAGVASTAPVTGVAAIAQKVGISNNPQFAPSNNAWGTAGGFASLANPSINTPTLNMPQIVSSKVDVGGRLDIRIASDGKANVERVESNNRNYDIDARAGGMYGAGA